MGYIIVSSNRVQDDQEKLGRRLSLCHCSIYVWCLIHTSIDSTFEKYPCISVDRTQSIGVLGYTFIFRTTENRRVKHRCLIIITIMIGNVITTIHLKMYYWVRELHNRGRRALRNREIDVIIAASFVKVRIIIVYNLLNFLVRSLFRELDGHLLTSLRLS